MEASLITAVEDKLEKKYAANFAALKANLQAEAETDRAKKRQELEEVYKEKNKMDLHKVAEAQKKMRDKQMAEAIAKHKAESAAKLESDRQAMQVMNEDVKKTWKRKHEDKRKKSEKKLALAKAKLEAESKMDLANKRQELDKEYKKKQAKLHKNVKKRARQIAKREQAKLAAELESDRLVRQVENEDLKKTWKKEQEDKLKKVEGEYKKKESVLREQLLQEKAEFEHTVKSEKAKFEQECENVLREKLAKEFTELGAKMEPKKENPNKSLVADIKRAADEAASPRGELGARHGELVGQVEAPKNGEIVDVPIVEQSIIGPSAADPTAVKEAPVKDTGTANKNADAESRKGVTARSAEILNETTTTKGAGKGTAADQEMNTGKGTGTATPGAPGKGTAAPAKGAEVPGKGAAVPGKGAAVPGKGAAVPGKGAAVPGKGAAVPGKATAAVELSDDEDCDKKQEPKYGIALRLTPKKPGCLLDQTGEGIPGDGDTFARLIQAAKLEKQQRNAYDFGADFAKLFPHRGFPASSQEVRVAEDEEKAFAPKVSSWLPFNLATQVGMLEKLLAKEKITPEEFVESLQTSGHLADEKLGGWIAAVYRLKSILAPPKNAGAGSPPEVFQLGDGATNSAERLVLSLRAMDRAGLMAVVSAVVAAVDATGSERVAGVRKACQNWRAVCDFLASEAAPLRQIVKSAAAAARELNRGRRGLRARAWSGFDLSDLRALALAVGTGGTSLLAYLVEGEEWAGLAPRELLAAGGIFAAVRGLPTLVEVRGGLETYGADWGGGAGSVLLGFSGHPVEKVVQGALEKSAELLGELEPFEQQRVEVSARWRLAKKDGLETVYRGCEGAGC